MRLFILTLILAVLAAAAIRVWFVELDEEEVWAQVGVAATKEFDPAKIPIPDLRFTSVADGDADTESLVNPNSENNIPVFYSGHFPDLREPLTFLGLDAEQFMEDGAIWYKSRGIDMQRFGFSLGSAPIQPYEQYDEKTLLSFAESGDMWAQQILGERWLMTRPGDSIVVLKQAAEQGSAQAMSDLGQLYSGNFGLTDSKRRLGIEPVAQAAAVIAATPDLDVESARWMGAAQIMSGGMFVGPDDGYFTGSPAANRNIAPERRHEMCVAALKNYEELQDARVAAGYPPFDVAAAPFFGVPDESDGQCDLPGWPRPDTSHCLQVRIIRPDRREHMLSFCPPVN